MDFSAEASLVALRVWIRFGTATVVMITMIATTIRSSRSEKPRSRRFMPTSREQTPASRGRAPQPPGPAQHGRCQHSIAGTVFGFQQYYSALGRRAIPDCTRTMNIGHRELRVLRRIQFVNASVDGPTTPSKSRDAILYGALLLAGVLPYLNTLAFTYVYDDNYQVLNNPYLRSWHYLKQILVTPVWSFKYAKVATNYYRPLMSLQYLILYQIY